MNKWRSFNVHFVILDKCFIRSRCSRRCIHIFGSIGAGSGIAQLERWAANSPSSNNLFRFFLNLSEFQICYAKLEFVPVGTYYFGRCRKAWQWFPITRCFSVFFYNFRIHPFWNRICITFDVNKVIFKNWIELEIYLSNKCFVLTPERNVTQSSTKKFQWEIHKNSLRDKEIKCSNLGIPNIPNVLVEFIWLLHRYCIHLMVTLLHTMCTSIFDSMAFDVIRLFVHIFTRRFFLDDLLFHLYL